MSGVDVNCPVCERKIWRSGADVAEQSPLPTHDSHPNMRVVCPGSGRTMAEAWKVRTG